MSVLCAPSPLLTLVRRNGFDAARDVDVAQRRGRRRREGGGPHERGCARAEQVEYRCVNTIVKRAGTARARAGRPRIARLVEVDCRLLAHVDEVGGAAAVDVGQTHATRVEAVASSRRCRCARPSRPSRQSAHSRGSASSRPLRYARERGRRARRRSCRRGRSRPWGSAKHECRAAFFVCRPRDSPRPVLKPLSETHSCQLKASSSVISTSARPSPLRSTKRRSGLSQSTLAVAWNCRNGDQPTSGSYSNQPGLGAAKLTAQRLPSPFRSVSVEPRRPRRPAG